jgi:hypothetical protein
MGIRKCLAISGAAIAAAGVIVISTGMVATTAAQAKCVPAVTHQDSNNHGTEQITITHACTGVGVDILGFCKGTGVQIGTERYLLNAKSVIYCDGSHIWTPDVVTSRYQPAGSGWYQLANYTP